MFLNILCEGGCLEQFMFSCYRDAFRFSFLIMTALLGAESLYCTQYSNHEHHTLYLLCVILKGFMYFRIILCGKKYCVWEKGRFMTSVYMKRKSCWKLFRSCNLYPNKRNTKAKEKNIFVYFPKGFF